MSGAPTPRPPGTCPAPSVELVALTRCPWAHQDDSSDVRRDRISTSSNPWTPTPSTLTLAEWLRHSGDGDGDGTCAEWTTAEWDDRRMGRPPNGTTAEWEDRRVVARGMGNVNRRVPDVRDVVSAPTGDENRGYSLTRGFRTTPRSQRVGSGEDPARVRCWRVRVRCRASRPLPDPCCTLGGPSQTMGSARYLPI